MGDIFGGMVFLGGVLMIVGLRMVGGCMSGYGISGLLFMLIFSVVIIVSMFVGGILFVGFI